MGRIIHEFKDNQVSYPTGIKIELDSGEIVTVANSSHGIKIYEPSLMVFQRLIWRCDNPSLLESMFPILKSDFIGSGLEVIVDEILERFTSKSQLLNYLENFKV